jgi:quercetin dioxygenase-like cupin family protein
MTLPPGQDLGGIHTSETVDVLLVLEGSLTMHLEHGPPTRLAVGDWIVQNGTAHSWTIDDAVPCTIASFVFGADATEQPRN